MEMARPSRQQVQARELKIKEVTMSDQYQNDESLELLDALEIWHYLVGIRWLRQRSRIAEHSHLS